MESPKPPNHPVEHETSRTLGRYQIQEELGRGAMGAVYKAFDPVISRTVALKTILIDDRAPDRAQMIERLKQEAKAAGGLDHPNIITIYDVGEENGAVYLSMQYVKGTTLANLLAESGVPSLPTFISWADQISGAVGFAHARGVIHRDLKPANIMVTEQGAIKVLDFGIAKIENASLTQTGLVIGTPGYMSPEQIAGRKVDHRSDIFSLGAVFYELVTREKPFAGDIATILYKIVNEDPVAPSIINPAVPGAVDAVIRKALAKDLKDRFQTCEEMRQALLQQSAPSLAKPVNVAATKAVGNRPAIPAGTRRAPQPALQLPPQIEEAPPRIWPRLLLTSALVLVAAASWAFYVHSRTGAVPPLVANLVNQIKPAQSLVAGTLSKYSTQAPRRAADDHSVTSTPPQNAQAANAAPTGSQPSETQPSATQASATPTSATSAPSITVAAPTLQPVAAQSSSDQPLSARPASDSASASTTPALSPATETSRKAVDSSQTSSTQDAESNDRNEPAAGNSSARHPLNSPFAPRADENARPSVPPANPKQPARKRAPEPALTVDGFTRQDVPDLLRQADSSAARTDYRLARYEYELVLKLDRNNVSAREGLRRLLAALQSR